MSASKYIKSQGLPSVQYVADSAGINRQLLHNWYNTRRRLFDVVVAGVKLKFYTAEPMTTKEAGEWMNRVFKLDENFKKWQDGRLAK